MVQEQTYSTYSYDADPKDRRSTYKAMETGGYKSHQGGSSRNTVAGSRGKQGTDTEAKGWGPVYKNKQNFMDMHIC